VTFRPLRADDAPAYQGIRLQSLRTDPLAFRTTIEEESQLPTAEFAKRLANDQNVTMGAFIGDELVGIGTLLRETRTSVRHRGEIVGMYVATGARGSGAADGIIQRLLDHARAVGVLVVSLIVEGNNARARRLYERWGFREYGRLPRAQKRGDQYTDEALMFLTLD
jgi:RimJ/RimL family protein N-acetyltransferase